MYTLPLGIRVGSRVRARVEQEGYLVEAGRALAVGSARAALRLVEGAGCQGAHTGARHDVHYDDAALAAPRHSTNETKCYVILPHRLPFTFYLTAEI